MTAMVVLYVRSLGQPLGALSTVVPGELPPLGQASTLRLTLLIADPLPPPSTPPPPPPPPPPLGPPLPRPVTVDRGDVRLAGVEAEFDDPLEVFQWRVVTTTGPDGTEQHRLDRLGSGRVTASRQAAGPNVIELEVPRLGSELQLDYEVRNEAGIKKTGRLDFGGTGDTRRDTVPMPDTEAVVVLVEGYAPVFVEK